MRSQFLVFLAGGLVWASAGGVALGQGQSGDLSQGNPGTRSRLLDYVGGLVPPNYAWPIAATLGQDDHALAYLTETIRRKPDDRMAYVARAYLFGKRGDFDQALADYTTALRLDPDQAGVYALRGATHGYKGDFDRAITDLTDALRLDPTNVPTLEFRGWFCLCKRAFDESINDYTAALLLGCEPANVHAMRAMVYLAKGDWNRAIEDIKAAHDIEPDNPSHLIRMGQFYLLTERYKEAAAAFTSAIQRDASQAPAFSGRASARVELGDYADAIGDDLEALRLDSNDASASSNLARLLATCPEARLRDGERAVRLGRRACELTDWQEFFSIDALAAAFAEIGNFDEAVKLEKKALELAPAKWGEVYRSRLKLYQAGRPFRESKPSGSDRN